jgi:chorismate mutase/prephenate dehydratase
VEAVVREVLSGCRSLESEERVVYLGPESGFCEVAALARFGSSAGMSAAASVAQVFDDVERRRAEYGLVPLESTSEGIVHQTLDLLMSTSLSICGELEVETSLHLLNKTGNVADVDKVYGHSASLVQCRRYLEEHLSKVSLIDVRSVSLAAQLAAEDHGAAAVGTELAAQRHEFRIAQSKIEDIPGARTRFVVIGRTLPRPSGNDKTTLILSTKDGPGALYEALRPFADRGINLTKIESRPARTNLWDYVFFIDVDGHITDRGVTSAVEDIKRVTRFVKVLGSYPKR